MITRLAFVLAALAAAPLSAAEEPSGREIYLSACAGCHGADATGGGPVAELLSVTTPDLTRIAARSDKGFDRLRVIHTIDGRSGLRAHGGAMPVFGALFLGDPGVEDAPDGTPVMASRRVLALVDWLEEIQR
jgi:mono/diheme cytochrome c family protein